MNKKEIYLMPGTPNYYVCNLMSAQGIEPIRSYWQGSGELGWDCAGTVFIFTGDRAMLVMKAYRMSQRKNNPITFDDALIEVTKSLNLIL